MPCYISHLSCTVHQLVPVPTDEYLVRVRLPNQPVEEVFVLSWLGWSGHAEVPGVNENISGGETAEFPVG